MHEAEEGINRVGAGLGRLAPQVWCVCTPAEGLPPPGNSWHRWAAAVEGECLHWKEN